MRVKGDAGEGDAMRMMMEGARGCEHDDAATQVTSYGGRTHSLNIVQKTTVLHSPNEREQLE